MGNAGSARANFLSLSRHLRQAWQLVTAIHFLDYSQDALSRELRTLVAPHMRVLIHKREKLVTDGGFVLSGRWLAELAAFAGSIERYLTSGLAQDRKRLLGLLDDIVWQAQLESSDALALAPLPATSRFDMRWAN